MCSTNASRERSRSGLGRGGGLLAIAMAAVLGLTGCAGYRLGPTNEQTAGATSVRVVPFVNETLQPALTDAVTAQVRKWIQRDGTFRLATGAEADLEVTGRITQYDRMELSLSRGDSLTVNDYRLSLTAQVTARDLRSGKVVLEQPVKGYTLVRVGSDLVSSERQALPLLAGELARNITTLLAEGSW